MHDTALETGKLFLETYGKDAKSVLDVGSLNVNGTLRQFIPTDTDYVGVDVESGDNVSLILDDPYQIPFPNESFAIVISTSCFEHTEFFWLTFLEMARLVKTGGFIYVNAPVQGPVHRYPIDAWRFYPDAGISLAKWAERNLEPISLVESFWVAPKTDKWVDFVGIWAKRPFLPQDQKLKNLVATINE